MNEDEGLHKDLTGIKKEMMEFNKEILGCLLYTSDAADERSSVDLGGRRIIKKKKIQKKKQQRALNKKDINYS